MSLAVVIPDRDVSPLLAAMRCQGPEIDIQCWPAITAPEVVKVALVWSVTEQMVADFENLSGVIAFGAGVDRLLELNALRDIPLARIVDPNLANAMARYVVAHVLRHHLRLADLMAQQQRREWAPISAAPKYNVVVLGAGQIGSAVARALELQGFHVVRWVREPRAGDDTAICGKKLLHAALASADYVINTLPLTSATRGILNGELFAECQRGCYLINVGRGEHLVETDLLAALSDGQLSGATLDVFMQEPLPAQHPFWQHRDIVVTPHCAALTDQHAVVAQVIENYRRVSRGLPMHHLIDRNRGY
ncbi:glyoxylate/hydroxypyruvate reductase A [Corallincola spongiicola]|uniref:Glyoxylate/hydroxypyruvate reductase A n=2 Tax=Corallincola spongiicola TaxID=2520508 RepID=A0ABY1WKP5_9GAMM|nr:glyoxylate/hydroxypyruvate reductase A [Corallincola spongiicola]